MCNSHISFLKNGNIKWPGKNQAIHIEAGLKEF